MKAWALVGALGTAATVLAGPGSAEHMAARPPTVQVLRASVDRARGTVDMRLRICFNAGPRAQVAITERRSFRGAVTTRRWVPSAEKPTRISPFACRSGWRLNWLLEPRLRGPGTYTATIRIRDAYSRWSAPVAVTLTSP